MRALGVAVRTLVATCRTICFQLSHHVESATANLHHVFDVDTLSAAPGETDIAPAFIGRDPPALAVS
jgi:hypothetical protein